MRLELNKVGRVNDRPIVELCARYEKRLRRYTKVEAVYLRDIAGAVKNATAGQEIVVGLDQRGESWSSEGLAQHLAEWRDAPAIRVVRFVVGPAYGFSSAERASFDRLWCLSAATLPGELCWVLLWEQLYRGWSILAGSAYHHGDESAR